MPSTLPFVLGTQYFRPPFPKQRWWADDFKAMRDAGLNAVQFWLVWGWVEPSPGRFRFDDYDRLAELADQHGLGVVLSTLPEVNPFWLPRLIPGGQMVDVEGHFVRSGPRGECLSGLVPGLCSDHPEVRTRMIHFLETCGNHFSKMPHLLSWDMWNENRWRNQAPQMVCFCKHSMANFRDFLTGKYGTIEKLGEAWGRRLADWHDIRPGRLAGNCYPEMHDFTAWLQWRAHDMACWRYEALDESDGQHPIGSHTGNPSIFGGINLNENIFSRGVDWDVAPGDCYGFSSFPRTGLGDRVMNPVDLAARMSSVTTVGNGKPVWMSELQGGPTAHSGCFGPPISGAEQQAWIWTGIARGCKGMLFWCWRPEVFGNEINGFGFLADDGFAGDRRTAMQKTSEVVAALGDQLTGFRPDAPRVGVLFQRDSYFYDWMRSQSHCAQPYTAPQRLTAWLHALERCNTHYAIHDDRHLPPDPSAYRLMIVPDPSGLDDRAAAWLVAFVQNGGVLMLEGGAGAIGPDTFYRYPNHRPIYQALRIDEALYRAATRETRTIPADAIGNDAPIEIALDGFEQTFEGNQGGVVRLEPDDLPMMIHRSHGDGRVIALGTTLGEVNNDAAMDAVVAALLKSADVIASVKVSGDGDGFCSARVGDGGDKRLLIATNLGGAQRVTLTLSEPVGEASDLMGHAIERGDDHTIAMDLAAHDVAVVRWR